VQSSQLTRRSIEGVSEGVDEGADFSLLVELGDDERVRRLARTAVAFDDVEAHELYEC
jgi:hypothetical protein